MRVNGNDCTLAFPFASVTRTVTRTSAGASAGGVHLNTPSSETAIPAGGSPYGAGTLAGADGSRQPSENELAIARFQGRHVAEITRKLVGG